MAKYASYPGITPPRSVAESTEVEVELSTQLTQFVESQDWYERLDEISKRKDYLREIETAVRAWVRKEAESFLSKAVIEDHGGEYGACVLPFGGLAFEIVPKGADIDAVCLLPKFIDRKGIFECLPEFLAAKPEVKSMRKVEEAWVPILSFTFRGIQIDLSFAILQKLLIPNDLDYVTDNVFRGLDEISIRSLSGIRDVKLILNLVPDVDTFINTVKVIKAWAKSKCLHSSATGYLGGIAWAIMAARACQLYPCAAVGTLVQRMFAVFAAWTWPMPVMLRDIVRSDMNLVQFNPRRMRHVMPVLTPSYPEHNTAYNVSASSLHVIRTHMTEASSLCEKIMNGEEQWSKLFEPNDFFELYTHFIVVCGQSSTAQEHLDWSGFLESQVRKLVVGLESIPEIKRLHLHAKTFENREQYVARWFIGLKLHKIQGKTKGFDISPVVRLFKKSVHEMATNRKILSPNTQIDIRHITRKDIAGILSSMSST